MYFFYHSAGCNYSGGCFGYEGAEEKNEEMSLLCINYSC